MNIPGIYPNKSSPNITISLELFAFTPRGSDGTFQEKCLRGHVRGHVCGHFQKSWKSCEKRINGKFDSGLGSSASSACGLGDSELCGLDNPDGESMVDVDKLTDAELRTKLLEFGFPVMPITGTTRKVMTKKLKLLLENKNKIGSEGGRRSMGRYSSEEESDSDVKVTKKRENRRATMAAPLMQPPAASTRGRKSTRLNDTPEPEISHSPSRRDTKTTTSTTTTRTQRLMKSAQDEFDTGSDSESDIISNNYNSPRGNDLEFKRSSPMKSAYTPNSNKYSPPKSIDTSYSSLRNISFTSDASPSRLTSYNSPSVASEYASDRLNQIRSRLSLGNSALSSQKKDYDNKDDIIKEHDTNGSSGFVRSQLSSYRAARGRDATYDYKTNQNSILKNNFVSFAVLAGAALFFVFLAIMYLGMRSDTSVIPSGYVIPHCIKTDPNTKRGVNCVLDEDIVTALHLLNDEYQIRNDLKNLEILSFSNPDWNINVAQTENNNGLVNEDDIAKNMEQVIFNYDHKITNKEKTWAKAMKFINENESRVRTEVQEVQGEPFEVWRWIGSANLSMTG
ncbi:hypothetical protein NQ314_005039 [Rhamnusium bicolor]|uniref:LEM domain-containing protein n=1 Tax=Rhamnusium bicolor TaxID=1586634 RepID=A0AAV8ZHY2_9CUCU|nr:hypothetical protein NQ314_005039 [Rhamnusium bicolor]